MKMIHAVYEHGVFRPLEAVELPERTEVEFEHRPVTGAANAGGDLGNIFAVLSKRHPSGEHDVAERHNEQKL